MNRARRDRKRLNRNAIAFYRKQHGLTKAQCKRVKL